MPREPRAPAQPSGQSMQAVTCATCAACCCRLEVLLLTETGVPRRYIATDPWGREVMARLNDGWCAALDRATLQCSIYPHRPLLCREYVVGADDCLSERGCLAHQTRPPSP
jgi:Fe-S-cluster containining protein